MTAIVVEPKRIVWEPNDTGPKELLFRSVGAEEMVLRVDAPKTDLAFDYFWAEIPAQRLCSTRRIGAAIVVKVIVHPPDAGAATLTSYLPFHAINKKNQTELIDYVELRNDSRNSVVESEAILVDVLADPSGPDLDGEGEFIVIENQRDAELDLNGCTLHQAVFNRAGKLTDAARLLATFSRRSSMASDFERTCRLPPRARLKVLSRAKRTSEVPADDPLRLYLGVAAPVWNNAGDIVTLRNTMGQTIIQYGYGTQKHTTSIGVRLTPRGPGVAKQIYSGHYIVGATWSIDAMPFSNPTWDLEDGDEISFVTRDAELADEYMRTGTLAKGYVKDSMFGRSFLPSGRWLQNGQVMPADGTEDMDWPLRGAPAMSLLAEFTVRDATGRDLVSRNPASIGNGDRFSLTLESRGQPKFRFGVNDRNLGDNQGFFEVDVIVWRR